MPAAIQVVLVELFWWGDHQPWEKMVRSCADYRFRCIMGKATVKRSRAVQLVEADRPLPEMTEEERSLLMRLLREKLEERLGEEVTRITLDRISSPSPVPAA